MCGGEDTGTIKGCGGTWGGAPRKSKIPYLSWVSVNLSTSIYLIREPSTLRPIPQLYEVYHFLSPLGGIPLTSLSFYLCRRERGGGGHMNVLVWRFAARDMTDSSYPIIPGEEGGNRTGPRGERYDYDDGNGGGGSVGGGGGRTLHLLPLWRT